MCSGRNSNAHMAGLNVSATTNESSTETTIVIENWRYSNPVMPSRKLTGTNTAASTSDVAVKAPVSSFMALWVASLCGSRSSFMIRSTFSTTTIASSTTIPMASTKPSKVSVFNENPMMSMKPNVPINEMGTAMIGMRAALQFCKEKNTTMTTRNNASNSVLYTSWIDCEIYSVMSNGKLYSKPSGKFLLMSFIAFLTFSATSIALAPGSMYMLNIAAFFPLIPLSVV